MPRIRMTYRLAMAAGMDAANASMRAAGRKAWNEDDYNVSVETFNRLYPLDAHLADLAAGIDPTTASCIEPNRPRSRGRRSRVATAPVTAL